MKSTIRLSEDEMVSFLKKTSLPTILVEGDDDCYVYRQLENKIDVEDVDILICNGRKSLINIFNRRHEFKESAVVFVADKDMWFFSQVPIEYKDHIIFTDGYSIENDLYNKDFLEGLLDQDELLKFRFLINELSIWFAFEVERHTIHGYSQCNVHINKICPDNKVCEKFKESIDFLEPPINLVKFISEEYIRALRGKNLFEALLRFLSHKNRASKYSRLNLIEMSLKSNNSRINYLFELVKMKFELYL
jgi:Protein of unknown function (DUF4435)